MIEKFGTAAVLILASVFCLTGCNSVHRRLTIESEPPGARVFVNDQEIGTTPIAQNFIYSGTYKIRFEMAGKETKTVMHQVRTPWYLYPGLDFFSENFVPGEIRDLQSCKVVMEPRRMITSEELKADAVKMREEVQNNAALQQAKATSAQAATLR